MMEPDSNYREGGLSPGVYSFAQMKGATSTTLVDFSCRFTWSVTDVKDTQDKNYPGTSGNQNYSYNIRAPLDSRVSSASMTTKQFPHGNMITNHTDNFPISHHSQFMPSTVSCRQRHPLPPVYSCPEVSSTARQFLYPVSSPLPVPPPQHGYHLNRPLQTPKTFSPVLLYQRPDFNNDSVGLHGSHGQDPRPILNRDSCLYGSYGQSHGTPSFTDCAKPDGYVPLLVNGVDRGQNGPCLGSFPPCQNVSWRERDYTFSQPKYCIDKTSSAFQTWKQCSKDITFKEPINTQPVQHAYTDSAKLKFFLDTKYALTDTVDVPFSPGDACFDLRPEFGSEMTLDHFADPLLELVQQDGHLQHLESDEDRRSGARKHKCPFCHVSCNNNGQLRGHMRVHTGEKPYHCDVSSCGRSFARNEELTRHRRIHSGIRPHTCSTCGKKFGRKDHLNKHLKTHLKTVDKKVHECQVTGCGQKYTRSDALARHQWGAHGIKSKSAKWKAQTQT